MPSQNSANILDAVSCPFCGLACDDLQVQVQGTTLAVVAKGCERSKTLFGRPARSIANEPQALIGGQPSDLASAVARAAEILRGARQPVFGGLATDVAGMRAVMRMADRTGASLDHMNANGLFRNLLVLQDSGWISTTLSEVRNRVDLLLVAGTDIVSRFPRFFERCVWNEESLFGQETASREVVVLGPDARKIREAAPAGHEPKVFPCQPRDLTNIFGALRCLVAGVPIQAASVGGIGIDDLMWLAERIRQARYGVLAWAAADLDFPHAELTVQTMCGLVTDINAHSRFSILPLGGNDGDTTANQVCVWQSGLPLRTTFGRGSPEYDPYHQASARMLERKEADALVWVSCFDGERTPPRTSVPVVVLGRSGMKFEQTPAVYIPVGVPGLDHAGHAYRTDNVVAVRLRKLRDTSLPSVAEVISAIEQAL